MAPTEHRTEGLFPAIVFCPSSIGLCGLCRMGGHYFTDVSSRIPLPKERNRFQSWRDRSNHGPHDNHGGSVEKRPVHRQEAC